MTDHPPLTPADLVEMNPIYVYRWEEAQQSHVLLYPEGLVRLNDTAAAVLGQCQGRRPVADIVHSLATLYGSDEIEKDIIEFLEVCLGKGWIRRAS